MMTTLHTSFSKTQNYIYGLQKKLLSYTLAYTPWLALHPPLFYCIAPTNYVHDRLSLYMSNPLIQAIFRKSKLMGI